MAIIRCVIGTMQVHVYRQHEAAVINSSVDRQLVHCIGLTAIQRQQPPAWVPQAWICSTCLRRYDLQVTTQVYAMWWRASRAVVARTFPLLSYEFSAVTESLLAEHAFYVC